ncbi:hypothetical protein LPJ64_000678 [Coemansia asiatica]|uniref:ZFAND2A/B-like C2H2 zinc finger domain-containing protein n=1 Tax=Coemansia asiatica TaxID=1052880 RepID=A0A9W7XPY4_9FUNG|nr:hypothetical protein LPJ64_000678 [Coemansia asiatica]
MWSDVLHGKADKHNCSKRDKVVDRKVPECPICGQPVPLRPNDSADDAVNRHVDAGCDHDCPRRNSSAPPSLNIGTKAIDAINGVFSRSKSEQRQNPKPSNGNGSAARNGRNNVPPARNSSSTSNKSKDSGCVIS